MEMKELIEGNKAIAEFMQIPRCDRCHICDNYKFGASVYYLPAEMQYHEDWNWLMQVVDKIESLTAVDGRGEVNFVVTMDQNYCVISVGGEGEAVEVQTDEEGRKLTTWYAVVRFAEWWKKFNEDEKLEHGKDTR